MVRPSSVLAAVTWCAAAAFVAAACGADEPLGIESELQDLSAVVPDVFGVKALPKKGCDTPAHRQFDFWVGRWDVYAGSNLAGTNVVEKELDGCIVEENWNDAAGRGRSLNMYDAAANKWSQMWAYSGGGSGAFVSLEGGLVDGTMHIEGTRLTPTGLEIFNTINWTPLSGGRVRQFGEIRTGTGPLQQNLDLEYRPVAAVTVFPEVPRTVCTARAQNRELDFALGSWTIRAKREVAARQVGTTRYSTDLSGCLVEERLSGPDGYEAWSFNTWHTVTQKWHRTYIDNRGLRLVLVGGLSGKSMVMTGKPTVDGRVIDVRITWTPDADTMTQLWEVSRDGAATWQQVATVFSTKGG